LAAFLIFLPSPITTLKPSKPAGSFTASCGINADIHLNRYGLSATKKRPEDRDWTGAEIQSCCRLSALLEVPLREAAKNVVSVAVTAAESVRALRDWASGRCLDAGRGGTYRNASEQPAESRRRVARPNSNSERRVVRTKYRPGTNAMPSVAPATLKPGSSQSTHPVADAARVGRQSEGKVHHARSRAGDGLDSGTSGRCRQAPPAPAATTGDTGHGDDRRCGGGGGDHRPGRRLLPHAAAGGTGLRCNGGRWQGRRRGCCPAASGAAADYRRGAASARSAPGLGTGGGR
jgi:hypothetical protein